MTNEANDDIGQGQRLPLAVSFAAPSGTGKTTLLVEVVQRLTRAGLRVATVKHHGHDLEVDTEGKDTWKLRRAGATSATLVGRNQVAWMSDGEQPPPLEEILSLFHRDADLVLVEGYRSAELPTVLVHRSEAADPSWQPPPETCVLGVVHPDEIDRTVDLLLAVLDGGVEESA